MPPISQKVLAHDQPTRSLIYGPAKTKKTTWALEAAELGYNIIYFNLDRGDTVALSRIKSEAHPRILEVWADNNQDKVLAAELLLRFIRGGRFYWNDTDGMLASTPAKPDKAHYVLDVSKVNKNTIVLIDTWTALRDALLIRSAQDAKQDVFKLEKWTWDHFGPAGAIANMILAKLRDLPCHVIVIAHTETYDKYSKVDKDAKGNALIEFSRDQPTSTSRAHGMTLAGYFDNVLRFYLQGEAYKIDSTATSEADGGCRAIPPKIWNYPELSFGKMIELSFGAKPNPALECEACRWYPAGDTSFSAAKPLPILQAGNGGRLELKATEPPVGSLAARLKAAQGKS
jgi:hypothetical protein